MPLYDGPPVIVAGNAHPRLAADVAAHLEDGLGGLTVGRFSDREIKVKFELNIRGRDVFVIQPTHSYGPIGSDSILELLIIIDAARRASAGRITAVTPYFGYARQDRKDEPRVPISAKLMAGLLEAAGANRLLAIDLHSGQVQGFTNLPFDHIYARPVFIQRLQTLGLKHPAIAATDLGSAKYARSWAKRIGSGKPILVDKERIDERTVRIVEVMGAVDGRDVLLVDDEVETGVTIVAAAQAMIDRGANSVRAIATHGKLIEDALARIIASPLAELMISDTLPPPDPKPDKITVVSIASLLADVIRDIHTETSVSRRFD